MRFFLNLILLFIFPLTTLGAQIESASSLHRNAELIQSSVEGDFAFSDVIDLILSVESGDFENNPDISVLQNIEAFVSCCAKEGASDEAEYLTIQQDLKKLVTPFESYCEYLYANNIDSEFTIIPGVYYGGKEFTQCNWFSKSWKGLKGFVKKHKKAILIGAAIVIGVSVGLYFLGPYLGLSGTGLQAAQAATTAGAAGVAASNPSSTSHHLYDSAPNHTNPSSEIGNSDLPLPIPPTTNHQIAENYSSFLRNETQTPKKQISSDPILNNIQYKPHLYDFICEKANESKSQIFEYMPDISIQTLENDEYFIEKLKVFGSKLTHDVVDYAGDAVYPVAKLLEEIKEVGDRFFSRFLENSTIT